jgi:hypothetical protein
VAPGCLTLAASSAGESLEVCSEEGGQDAEGGPSPHSHLQLPGTTRPHTIHTLSIWSRALSKLAGWSPVALSIAAPGSVAGAEWGPLAGAQQVRTAGQDQRLPKATRNASAGPCEMPKKQLGHTQRDPGRAPSRRLRPCRALGSVGIWLKFSERTALARTGLGTIQTTCCAACWARWEGGSQRDSAPKSSALHLETPAPPVSVPEPSANKLTRSGSLEF